MIEPPRTLKEIARPSQTLLKGLRIEIPPQPCVFTLEQARQGITFRYEVVIERDMAGFLTGPQDAGCCQEPGPGNLYPFPQIVGNGQRYALYDAGYCDCSWKGRPKRLTLKKGRYQGAFFWNGVNWSGPSDFDNPQGRPFPPGTYRFGVRIMRLQNKQPPEHIIGGMQIKLIES